MTNRERILALREGYVAAKMEEWIAERSPQSSTPYSTVETVYRERARNKYPLPKKTVPRVVQLAATGTSYKIMNGEWFYNAGFDWKRYHSGYVDMIKDLIANPTVEVEDDE